AFDIQIDTRRKKFFAGIWFIASLEFVVRDGEKDPAERIEVGHSGRTRMHCRAQGSSLLCGAQCAALALGKPYWQVVRVGETGEKVAYIRVGFRIFDKDCIIHIPSILAPRTENDFFPSVVRMQRGNDAFDGIVEHNRADADANV